MNYLVVTLGSDLRSQHFLVEDVPASWVHIIGEIRCLSLQGPGLIWAWLLVDYCSVATVQAFSRQLCNNIIIFCCIININNQSDPSIIRLCHTDWGWTCTCLVIIYNMHNMHNIYIRLTKWMNKIYMHINTCNIRVWLFLQQLICDPLFGAPRHLGCDECLSISSCSCSPVYVGIVIQDCQLIPHHVPIIGEREPLGTIPQQGVGKEVLYPPCCPGVDIVGETLYPRSTCGELSVTYKKNNTV